MVTTRPPKTIVKPTALGPVANTDTKLLIYGLFQKGRVLAQDGVATMEFQLSGSCHYHLADKQLTDLTVENVRLLTSEPDGSVRAVKGSYVNLSAHMYAGGPLPVLPSPETLD